MQKSRTAKRGASGLTLVCDITAILPWLRYAMPLALRCTGLEPDASLSSAGLAALIKSPPFADIGFALTVQENPPARRYYVSGMVQGVGFRFFAQRVAERLGLAGYVKNLRDGRVEVYAIGQPSQLASLLAELERGPRSAIVSEVTEEEVSYDPQYADGFSVERDTW